MRTLSSIFYNTLAVLSVPLLLIVLLALPLIVSCSAESMDIPEGKLYDIEIKTTTNTKHFNSFGHTIYDNTRSSSRDYYAVSSVRLSEIKQTFPAGTTVKETTNPRVKVTTTVVHLVKTH